MKDKFESILLQLKSNLKSDSVIDALSTEKDKDLHERLINVINRYYENIDLFNKQKETLQKLLFDNANNLLSRTDSGSFRHYLDNYRNYANFLVDNYYKAEDNDFNLIQNNVIKENNIDFLKIEESIQKIRNTNLDELSKNVEKIKNADLNVLQQNLNFLKNIDLKKLNEQIANTGFAFNLDKLKDLDLDKFQKSLDAVKKLNLDRFQNDVKNIQNNINLIDEKEFEKRYMKLVSLLNSENNESNLILYTKAENKPFKLYKNSNNSIFIKAGQESSNMNLPLSKCISIIYKNEEARFRSYTEILFPKIFDNTIFDEIIVNTEVLITGSEMSSSVSNISAEEINNEDKSLIDKKDIIKTKPIIYNNAISKFDSDVPSNNNIDCLNIGMDVNAFAKLIANKSLQPPLAIGLFGKWGSGKSFFMEEVEKKIKKLSVEENSKKVFHEEIVHIKFNAWHYSDSNLWANLMIQIFEGLNKFLKPNEVDKIESLYLQLESTKEFLKEKEDERVAIQNKITDNKKELTGKINQKIEKTFALNQLKDISRLVFEDEYVKSEFNEIRKDFPFLKEEDINSIYKLYGDLNNNYGILKKFFIFLFKEKLFRRYLLGIFLVLMLISGLYFCIEDIKLVLSPLLIFLPIGYKYMNKFNKITSKISKFIEFYERKKSENSKDEIQLNLLKEQANLESELTILEETISLENKKLEEISFEIEHIKSGKYLADFIMERANSSDYKQHLGLISLIRNDLEKLNEYLKQPVEDAEHKIDRIVLYIDDLDRCSEDKVMDVLEAIHLLLAFDLFIVIVGVDTRWIKKSLEEKRNLEKDNSKNIATSKEYLEKIFQIPFHLQNMEEDIKKQLVEKLLKNDLIKENFESKSDDLDTNDSSEHQISSSNYDDTDLNLQEDLNKDFKIAQYEYDYILEVAKLLGESPRTIKRFVNIYRLIRSHEYVLKELLQDFREEYKFITMLLCLNDKTDNKEDELNVNNYLQELKELDFAENDKENFERFMKKDELFKFISRFSFRDCK